MNKSFHTVNKVDLDKFITKWYVIAGRLTMFEDGAHNAIEHYSWDKDKETIKINFYFNKDSFTGKRKTFNQKAWIYNHKTNAHWKVRPFWPLKLDYIILDIADDYSWTAVGVPSQKYLWIMSKDPKMSEKTYNEILARLKKINYSIEGIIKVPQDGKI